jgi:type IV secretion system protein VirB6
VACPQVYSGTSFLSSTLAYVDCQAQSLGTFGFQALSAPSSLGEAVVTGLLTLFVAIFGYRLILGYSVHGRDVFSAVLKIGIVLTLATSWSTFRTLAYDTVLYGPAEVAGAITGVSELSSRYALADRLENVDAGIAALTVAGTGRNSAVADQPPATGAAPTARAGQNTVTAPFAAVAVDDEFGMGFSRVSYLAGTLAPLVTLRLAAGVLIAVAPLLAGLLLFKGTQGMFFGWLRALMLVALGSLVMIISLSVELTLLEPWLTDVFARRAANLATPAAPTELVVITTTFAMVAFALLFLFARLAFNPAAVTSLVQGTRGSGGERAERSAAGGPRAQLPPWPSRASQVAERLTTIHRGERQLTRDDGTESGRPVSVGGPRGGQGGSWSQDGGPQGSRVSAGAATAGASYVPLGESYRRSTTRSSRAANTRDRRL